MPVNNRAAALAAAIALLVAGGGAAAQTGGETPNGAPSPPSEAAPATTPPAASPSPPPPGTATPPATSDAQQLPDVQVIQQQAKPPAPKKQQAAKPKKPPTVAQTPPPTPIEQSSNIPEPTQVRMSPVGGSELPIAKVPGSVSTVSSSDVARSGAVAVQDVLQSRVPGVIVNDLQGNEFQTDVQYRGFEASPVNGVPQGLAVYENGVRINEAFGDVVNWDFLPSIAIADIAVMSNNPAFGLNALGGSISLTMKDGFNFQGVETDFRMGSFGRVQGSVQAGQQSGNWAAYIGVEDIHDEGWRQFSPADIRRLFADIGFKNHDAEFHANFTGADNFVGVVAASPVELLDQSYSSVFTNPQTTQNDMAMGSVNGSVNVTDTLKVSGVSYYRRFNSHHVDGNASDAYDCGDGTLCFDNIDGTTSHLIDQSGGPVLLPANGDIAIGELDRTSQQAESFGGSLQGVEKSKILGHNNQFLLGGSIDHGRVGYQTNAEIGSFVSPFHIVGDGQIVQNSDIEPVNITTTNTYYGVFFSDTFDVTDRLALTAGGRFNYADIRLQDNTGLADELNGHSKYQRFNPMAGGTYQLIPGLTLFSGYSEANRAPVAAELACADPNNPCLIESFLTGDPPLKQVVSRTAEVGLRGEITSLDRQKIDWSLGYFHAMNSDDIISVASSINGRSFFQNAGQTLREGLDASIEYRNDRLHLFANYNFTDARFMSTFDVNSPNNPLNPSQGDDFITTVRPGDRVPGIPQHRFKAGFDYWMTRAWKFGGDLTAASDQIFFGDEANQNTPLGGYAVVNLHTSYDITKNVQVYALVNNIFDHHYGTYGTYFNTEDGSAASLNTIDFEDARSITPATPLAAYGGVKVRF